MQSFFDRFGFGFSMICMIHCLLMPVILLTVPTIATVAFLGDEHTFHLFMFVLVVPIAVVSLFMGCRNHADRRKFSYVVWLFFTGILILLYVGLTPSIHGVLIEKLLTLVGSGTLAGGHILNHKLCKKGKCHTEHTG